VGPAPFEAHFTDLSTEDPSAWEWTFGDGGTSTDQNPVHTYSAEGLHTVSLTARSASGSDTAVYSDLIAVPEPAVWLQLVSGCLGLWVISARCRKRHSSGRFAELVLKVVIVLFTAVTAAHAVSTETSNGCSGTQDDPCIRSGSCEIQGAVWTQDVTIDRADTFDTQGWPGLCDMVHVGLVQGNCEPAGAQTDVTVHLSANSFAWVPSIVGPLACAGEPQPVPAFGAIGRLLLGGLLLLVGLVRTRPFSA